MLTIRAMTGAAGYAERYLSQAGDYYSQNEAIFGEWIGRGAELLGLRGEVQMAHFEAIREGLHPSTGEALRPRQSSDRFNTNGERTSIARNLCDFTVSAPKSVSVLALEDPRLITAHNEAVRETAAEMESLAAARIRRFGANDNRTTGNLAIAAFTHDTSRELDPQLHTHLVAGNLTYDGAESRWKALQASEIYQQREYLSEVYRNSLAGRIHKLGYSIVNRFEGAQERGFEIEGINAETLEKFSQRSA